MSEEARRREEAWLDFTERRAMKMSLADFLAPMLDQLDQGEKASTVWWEFDVRYKDGTLIRVNLEASMVEYRARIRA